jgi:hypothetical protein
MNDETLADTAPSLSKLVVPLLKGVVYQETDGVLWASLLSLQARVRDYVAVIGLELILDEAEGYAFLRSQPQTEEAALPRLIARRPLSYPVSLILALLREKLAEFDASGGDTRLVLTRDEIAEIVRVFLPENSNEARLADQLETHLNKIADMGFLRRLKTSPGGRDVPTFEVRRILKAFVDAQWLADLSAKLAAQGAPAKGDEGDE